MQRILPLLASMLQCNMRFRRHINSLAGIAGLGLICLGLLGCSSYRGISIRSSNEIVAEAFLSAALGREGRFSDDVLSKWCGPVGVALPGRVPAARRNSVLRELEALSGLTAVDFREGAAPGIQLHYPVTAREREALISSLPISSPAARRRVASARCYFVLQADTGTGCLTRADVVLPAELDDQSFAHCVAEEFGQAMGLPYDVDAGDGSIFSRTGRAAARTPLDDLFLKLLYDGALKPGSTRAALEQVVPGLVDRHR